MPATRSRRWRSPTSSSTRAWCSSPGISARARSIPASAVYNEEGILQISPASTNPKLTEQGFDNVFRTCGRDDVQGIYAANYVVDNKAGEKVAILHDKTAYGKGLADEFKKELNRRGVTGGHVRGDHRRRQGLHRADHQDEGGRRRPDLSSAATTPRPA